MENFAIIIRGVPGIPCTEAVILMTREFVTEGYTLLEAPEIDLENQSQGRGVVFMVDYEARIAIEMTQHDRTPNQARVHAYMHCRQSVTRFVGAEIPEGLRKVLILNGLDYEFDETWNREMFYPYLPMPTTVTSYTEYLCWSLCNFRAEAIPDLTLEERSRLHTEASGRWFGVSLGELPIRDIEAHALRFEGYLHEHPLIDQVRMFVYPTFLME